MKNSRKEFLKFNKTILNEKFKESLISTLPIVLIVLVISFIFIPISSGILITFLVASVLLVLGMGIFSLGADLAMSPIGTHIGASVTKSKKVWLIVLVSFIIGCIITVSEPNLLVLAEQVGSIPQLTLVLAVALGVGILLVVAMLRILFKIRLSYILIGLYIVTFTLAIFVPESFLAIAFDAGGVTTGPMTVPFIIAIGVGVGATRSDKNAEDDSFGLVALCAIGPILAVMILGLIFKNQSITYVPSITPDINNSFELIGAFGSNLPRFFKEVAIALAPIIVFFILYNITNLKLKANQLIKIFIGLVYTYLGLVAFLTAVNVGFLPIGNYLGQELGKLSYSWIVVPIGMVVGYFIVSAEPAVHILNKQVYKITSGAIPKKALSISLSIGVALSIGLSMLRIICNIPLMYFLIPGYAIAILLTFFVPRMFVGIAFDAGGVASGPMTATFLLPFAIGLTDALKANVIMNAFGLVALVTMTPLITIQILGLYFKIKTAKSANKVTSDEEVIDIPESNMQIEDIIQLGGNDSE